MRWLHRYLLVGLAALPVAIPCHAQTISDPALRTHHRGF
jgi:hypothetical protein